jgi:hypothetical protein
LFQSHLYLISTQIVFDSRNDHVRLVDFIKDPLEREPMDMSGGVEALISAGAEKIFGAGTTEFLREAHRRQNYMKIEIIRRYGLENITDADFNYNYYV